MLPNITVTKSFRRTIAMHIEPDGKILVKAPRFVSDGDIRRFIERHSDWIEKHQSRITAVRESKKDDEYLFLGKSLTLSPGNHTTISVKEDKLLFPKALLFRKEKEITSWYLTQARQIITKQTEKFAREMQADYRDITFSDTKSQWGRCTRDNRLQFSWRLVMAPILVLNYVVIHELSHTTEKNHSRAFWARVRQINPSYRQQLKWLKEHGSSLKVVV